MLAERGVVEQRLAAVLEVLDAGAAVTDVARRYGVARQTVHLWLRRYGAGGLAALADRSSRPATCPHQMAPEVEARVVGMRRQHPGWGSRTILYWLDREGVVPLPGRTSVDRCLTRHGLVAGRQRRRRRSDYRRWERSAAMELWQMDVVGGVRLADGSEVKIVSGIDDHSRYVISGQVVVRAIAGPVCDALQLAIRRFGAPKQILTDNGKVFTDRFGPGPGPVRFDRICAQHDIRHLLTAPRSPTTTGKIERWHKTLRREFLNGKVFQSIADAQAQLDGWVHEYNHDRPHQSIGRVPPIQRFRLAPSPPGAPAPATAVGDTKVLPAEPAAAAAPPVATRVVSPTGVVSFATARYHAGTWLAGQHVEVQVDRELVQLFHQGVLIATHARRHPVGKEQRATRTRTTTRSVPPPRRPAPAAASVTRKVDSSGNVSFAGHNYRVGAAWRRRQVQVAVVGDRVEISVGTELIRAHPVRHDRTREHGALANPGGRPHRVNAA